MTEKRRHWRIYKYTGCKIIMYAQKSYEEFTESRMVQNKIGRKYYHLGCAI